ncbi:MAG: hypothetical protein JRG71_10050 [Deltaproteobacteria bacterium]|nr:hypothetical protein [Deltaproteobacteria bacterium]
MRFTITILITIILLPSFAQANDYTTIAKQLKQLTDKHDILIIGEQHGKQESTKLITELTNYLTQNDTNLSIALEVGSDQQAVIDRLMYDSGSVSDIEICQIIDHPAYREMLSGLKNLIAEGRRLQVIAIDGVRKCESRDAWMAEMVVPLINKGKVLCLVGNLHAIKRIRWESGDHNPYLAERIISEGYTVCSVFQLWGMGGGGTLSRISIDDVTGMLDLLSAYMPDEASEFGDYAVSWE